MCFNEEDIIMAVTFSDAEKHICSLFSVGSQFKYKGTTYTVKFVGKPTCSHGEPKTDVYVNAASSSKIKEFKISFKKKNADFLENKTNKDRATQLFGPNWDSIIIKATSALQREFELRPLIYKKSHKKTEAGVITLGWKFELLNVNSGKLSGSMRLSRSQVVDVYAGTNLTCDKRDASVNGITISNSGIANFILFEEHKPKTIQDAADLLMTIDKYVDLNPDVYFACKALNYRTFCNKYDGDRPLAVYVDWSVAKRKLVSKLVFNEPLIYGGNYAARKLLNALKKLDVNTTDDLNNLNVADISTIWNG